MAHAWLYFTKMSPAQLFFGPRLPLAGLSFTKVWMPLFSKLFLTGRSARLLIAHRLEF